MYKSSLFRNLVQRASRLVLNWICHGRKERDGLQTTTCLLARFVVANCWIGIWDVFVFISRTQADVCFHRRLYHPPPTVGPISLLGTLFVLSFVWAIVSYWQVYLISCNRFLDKQPVSQVFSNSCSLSYTYSVPRKLLVV